MSGSIDAPVVDGRRRAALLTMLEQLVPACLPDWRAGGGQGDVAQAILSVAASLEAEVTQRLDRVPDKQFRNFLDWIGIRRDPALAAKLFVVLLTAPRAAATVLALARLRLQAQAPGGPIVFETDQDVLVVPGKLAQLIAVDGSGDKLYLPVPSLLAAAAPDSVPRVRALAGPAGAKATVVQITPSIGLAAGQSIGIGGAEYRIADVKEDLVSIEPPLDAAATPPEAVVPITNLVPFPPGAAGDPAARNWQSHELYIGATDLLNIDSDATIVVNGGDALAGATWTYWGLEAGSSAPDWLEFNGAPSAGKLTLAKKKKNSTLPQTMLFGRNSRWLRATAASPPGPTTLDNRLSLTVSTLAATPAHPVRVDALANTVPLVVSTEFFPLGREPRPFDQFYVSAPEAMSKKNASVTLTFKAADESFGPLVPSEGMAFAMRQDGVLVQIGPVNGGLPRTVIDAPTVPQQSRSVLFDANRPPSVAIYKWPHSSLRLAYAVAVSQEHQVWLWRGWNLGAGAYRPIGWVPLNAPTGTLGPVGVALSGTSRVVMLAAVKDTIWTATLRLFDFAAPATGWQAGASLSGKDINQIAVIRRPAGDKAEQIVLVDQDGSPWRLDDPAGTTPVKFSGVTVSKDVIPASLWKGNETPWIVTADTNNVPLALRADPAAPQPVAITGGRTVADAGGFGLVDDFARPRPYVLFRPRDLPRMMVVWPIGDPPLPDEAITQDADLRGPPVSVPAAGGTRTVILVPASNRAVYSRDWTKPDPLVLPESDLRDGVRLSLPPQVAGANQGPALLESLPARVAQRSVHRIEQQVSLDGDHVFRPAAAFPAGVGPTWRLLVPSVTVLSGTIAGSMMTLDASDTTAADGDVILIGHALNHGDFSDARSFRLTGVAGGTAILNSAPGRGLISAVQYLHASPSGEATGTILPTLANVPAGSVQAVLARGLLVDATPDQQAVQGAATDPFLVLGAAWTIPPQASGGQIAFAIPPAAPGPWAADQQQVVANPELSWEYWNGSSWWLLNLERDSTLNLLVSGDVSFSVPADLAPTDVAGRNQPWIRARLTGGDYGKEVYKLTNISGQSQIAERDTSQIHPPRMLSLKVDYTLDAPQAPDFLLTFDSLGLSDQSAANRLPGAKVIAFQPVGDLLAGFGPDQAAAGMRALFLGIDAAVPPSDGVIRLLAFVREQPGRVRLMAETLREGHFTELPLTDDTRGLGQDGLLSILLNAPLQLANLFGNDRYWLRLRPRPDDPGLAVWQPVLEGLYLNAASAIAAETQDLEILGSSDGSPGQKVTLGRPPVLAGSLDLRVREPLSDEDIAALRMGDPGRVRTDIPGRPGAWVRWTEVPDVVDASPGDRVYALDPATGDIVFGDAQAGLVPPVGRDCIAALEYRRVGTAAANQVPAWASLNLVTTLQGVEQVVAPRPAAGGADPGTDAATVADAPAALRDRGRAITGADLEAIALANSPEFAQARYIQSGRTARLVVVAKGPNPVPGKAQREALRARLATVTLPRLAAAGGLKVDPPVLRPLAVTAVLMVESLDIGGTVDAAAQSALSGLLDPATGGVGGGGWPLGMMPDPADVMALLVDIDGLLDVASVTFADVGQADGLLHTPERAFAAGELAVLAPDRLTLTLKPVSP